MMARTVLSAKAALPLAALAILATAAPAAGYVFLKSGVEVEWRAVTPVSLLSTH